MAAITVRSLPDDVHAHLRAHASARGTSVEAFVRGILADATKSAVGQAKQVTGVAEAQQRFLGPGQLLQPPTHAPSETPDLWGALRGTVQLSQDADLAAPVGEVWDAAG
jgi:plasmid stability protein